MVTHFKRSNKHLAGKVKNNSVKQSITSQITVMIIILNLYSLVQLLWSIMSEASSILQKLQDCWKTQNMQYSLGLSDLWNHHPSYILKQIQKHATFNYS